MPHILDNKHVTITSHTDYNIRQDYAAKARGITWLSNEILTLYTLVISNFIKSFFSSRYFPSLYIPRILWEPKVHYPIHNSLPFVPCPPQNRKTHKSSMHWQQQSAVLSCCTRFTPVHLKRWKPDSTVSRDAENRHLTTTDDHRTRA